MLLIIDNFDSFTYNLVDYFEQLGETCYVVKNDLPPALLPALDFTRLVLSPGSGKPEQAGYLLEYIRHFEKSLPILGICLGHQAIAQHYGMQIVKAMKPMHGKISEVSMLREDNLFLDMPARWEVVRYHSLVVKFNAQSPLLPLAITNENENMVLKHNKLPIYGIQYHPEAALSQFGLQILANWMKVTTSADINEVF